MVHFNEVRDAPLLPLRHLLIVNAQHPVHLLIALAENVFLVRLKNIIRSCLLKNVNIVLTWLIDHE